MNFIAGGDGKLDSFKVVISWIIPDLMEHGECYSIRKTERSFLCEIWIASSAIRANKERN